MQIYTVHKGTLISGVVVKRTPAFVEVAITSPYSKLFTSSALPRVKHQTDSVEMEALGTLYKKLLIELYQVGHVISNVR